MQVTSKGLPLYTFAGDTKAAQAKGQGVKDVRVWTTVTANVGTTAESPAATTAPASSSSSGGGSYVY